MRSRLVVRIEDCRQLGFAQDVATPYGLTTPGGDDVVVVTYEARIGSQNVEVVELSVPDTVAVAVNITCTQSA